MKEVYCVWKSWIRDYVNAREGKFIGCEYGLYKKIFEGLKTEFPIESVIKSIEHDIYKDLRAYAYLSVKEKPFTNYNQLLENLSQKSKLFIKSEVLKRKERLEESEIDIEVVGKDMKAYVDKVLGDLTEEFIKMLEENKIAKDVYKEKTYYSIPLERRKKIASRIDIAIEMNDTLNFEEIKYGNQRKPYQSEIYELAVEQILLEDECLRKDYKIRPGEVKIIFTKGGESKVDISDELKEEVRDIADEIASWQTKPPEPKKEKCETCEIKKLCL